MRSHWTSLFTLLAAVTLMAGCLPTAGAGGAAPQGAADLHDQLFKLQKDSARILEKLDTLEQNRDEGSGTQAVCAEAVTRIAELSDELRVMEEQILATQRRLDEALVQLRALKRTPPPSWLGNEPVTPPAAATAAPGQPGEGAETATAGATTPPAEGGDAGLAAASPEDLFNAAYADYSRGQLELALAGFEGALRADPEGPLADDAQYWVGETLYAMSRYVDAVAAFEHLIAAYPEGDKLARAHLKKGLSLFEGRRTAEGVQALEYVITMWPDSDEARIAREYFRRKGIIED